MQQFVRDARFSPLRSSESPELTLGRTPRPPVHRLIPVALLIGCGGPNAGGLVQADATATVDITGDVDATTASDAPSSCLVGVPCDDGNACTTDDTCVLGVCAGVPVVCDDAVACTTDRCNPQTGSCIFGSEGCDCTSSLECAADNLCTRAQCFEGTCIFSPVDCPQSTDPCRANVCSLADGACVPVAANESATCDDGRACTLGDHCSSGTCSGEAVVCDDEGCAGAHCVEPTGSCVDTRAQPCHEGPCPIAFISCSEGPEVPARTVVHCTASNSIAEVGQVVAYQWSVKLPDGASGVAVSPSNDARDISFEALAIGVYVVELEVWDSEGRRSCEPDDHRVGVDSDWAMHVELQWSGDADLDLHVLHKNASGYFDARWDTHWASPAPNWAGASTNDDPTLSADLRTVGPEVFGLNFPEFNATYTVGVHHWSGEPAAASLRVYSYGEKRLDWSGVILGEHDMWNVCEFDWPSGEARATGGPTPVITHDVSPGLAKP